MEKRSTWDINLSSDKAWTEMRCVQGIPSPAPRRPPWHKRSRCRIAGLGGLESWSAPLKDVKEAEMLESAVSGRHTCARQHTSLQFRIF